MYEYKPLGKRVLIKPVKEEERTSGGIYIPETAKEKKKQGIVLELGSIDEKELPIKKGDIILYTGLQFRRNGNKRGKIPDHRFKGYYRKNRGITWQNN